MPDYNVLSIFSNYVFVSAVSSWMLAQIAKAIVNLIKNDGTKINNFLFGTGGMPSSHSAVVLSLFTSSVFQYGFTSFEFAVTGVLAMIVIRDATGVRFETGKQAKFLNKMVEEQANEEHIVLNKNDKFKELIGHTPLQVFFGALLGIVVASVLGVFMVVL